MVSRKVLVVAAHPDDEVLGCGGTMAWHAERGDEVHVLLLGRGIFSREGGKGAGDDASRLEQASREANRILGVRSLESLDFPDNRMDDLARLEVVKAVEGHIAAIAPEIVYTHHGGDLNIDHRRTHEAVMTACRPQPCQGVRQILCFEVPSSTEWQAPGQASAFVPNWFVEIDVMLRRKLEALAAYESEMRNWPHARSIRAVEHLAHWRGATVGAEAAEAFVLVRRVLGAAAAAAGEGECGVAHD